MIKVGRWIMLLFLLAWAYQKCRDLNLELPELKSSWAYPLMLAVGGLCAHGVQAGMTWLITRFCEAKVPYFKCLSLNVLGGLWGMLLPMGSVAYKAVALKRDHGLSMSRYGSFYGLATMANVWASLILLYYFGVFEGQIYGFLVKLLVLTGPLWVFVVLQLMSKWPTLNKYTGEPMAFGCYLVRFFSLVAIQLIGAMVYLGIYALALGWMSVSLPLGPVMVVVVMQSVLFLAPVVPGNAVVLEGAGMWWLAKFGVEPAVGIAAILLMRLSILGTLLSLSPWATWHLSKPVNS